MKKRKNVMPWLQSMPAMILIGMIIVFPVLYTGYISLTNMNLFHWFDFEVIGFSNYARALTKVDSGFLSALLTTILWTAVNMVVQVVLAFFIALGLNTEGLTQSLIRRIIKIKTPDLISAIRSVKIRPCHCPQTAPYNGGIHDIDLKFPFVPKTGHLFSSSLYFFLSPFYL